MQLESRLAAMHLRILITAQVFPEPSGRRSVEERESIETEQLKEPFKRPFKEPMHEFALLENLGFRIPIMRKFHSREGCFLLLTNKGGECCPSFSCCISFKVPLSEVKHGIVLN